MSATDAAQQWRLILKVLSDYYAQAKELPVAAYAHHIRQLALRCYSNRAEIGGWAGEFTRMLLLVTARDKLQRAEHWKNPPAASWRVACDWILGDRCASIQAGYEHFAVHLAPGLHGYIKQRLTAIGRHGSPRDAFDRIQNDMLSIIREHNDLLRYGATVATNEAAEWGPAWARDLIGRSVVSDAIELRREIMSRVRTELAAEGIITPQQAERLPWRQ